MLRDSICESLGLDPLLTKQPRLVTVSAIAQDGDNVISRSQFLGHLYCSDNVECGRGADIDAFLVEETVDHVERICVGDLEGVVDQLDIGLQVLGDASLTNACLNR